MEPLGVSRNMSCLMPPTRLSSATIAYIKKSEIATGIALSLCLLRAKNDVNLFVITLPIRVGVGAFFPPYFTVLGHLVVSRYLEKGGVSLMQKTCLHTVMPSGK